MAGIYLQSIRKTTFNKNRRGAQKSLNWPHPTAPKSLSILPEKLAQAGFAHKPSADSADNVICFLCDAQVQDWESNHNPLERHLEINQHCGFAIMTETVRLDWMNVDSLNWHDHPQQEWPNSDRMKQARLDSFSVGWPHEDNPDMPSVQSVSLDSRY